MENSANQELTPLTPLEPIRHLWVRAECTPPEAFRFLPPQLQGVFFAILAARANAHITAKVLGHNRTEQELLLNFLDEITSRTLSQLLTFPWDIGFRTACQTLDYISNMPRYFDPSSDIERPPLLDLTADDDDYDDEDDDEDEHT